MNNKKSLQGRRSLGVLPNLTSGRVHNHDQLKRKGLIEVGYPNVTLNRHMKTLIFIDQNHKDMKDTKIKSMIRHMHDYSYRKYMLCYIWMSSNFTHIASYLYRRSHLNLDQDRLELICPDWPEPGMGF